MKRRIPKHVRQARAMRCRGWDDYKAGKPITDYPGGGERLRAEYQIGWHCAKDGEERPSEIPQRYL